MQRKEAEVADLTLKLAEANTQVQMCDKTLMDAMESQQRDTERTRGLEKRCSELEKSKKTAEEKLTSETSKWQQTLADVETRCQNAELELSNVRHNHKTLQSLIDESTRSKERSENIAYVAMGALSLVAVYVVVQLGFRRHQK